MHWSKKYTQCRNCGTQRFPHKLFGYCARCFHSVKRLEEVRLWNLNQPQTLKGYPRDMIFHTPKTFERVKKGHLKQYKERLEGIRYSEEKLQWPISGHDIEHKIREVAILSGVDGVKLFFGTADSFNRHFDAEQRKVLYEKLNRITESVKWKGIDWNKLFFDK